MTGSCAAFPPQSGHHLIAVTGYKNCERELANLRFAAVVIEPIEAMELCALVVGCIGAARPWRP